MTTGCSQAGRHSRGGAVPSFEAETKALFNYPSRGRAGGAGCQTRCAGRSRVSGLGLSGMPEDGWAWLEHCCSGDSAHPGMAPAGKPDPRAGTPELRVGGPCTLGLTCQRMQGHKRGCRSSLFPATGMWGSPDGAARWGAALAVLRAPPLLGAGGPQNPCRVAGNHPCPGAGGGKPSWSSRYLMVAILSPVVAWGGPGAGWRGLGNPPWFQGGGRPIPGVMPSAEPGSWGWVLSPLWLSRGSRSSGCHRCQGPVTGSATVSSFAPSQVPSARGRSPSS